jgi:hypothetical protein
VASHLAEEHVHVWRGGVVAAPENARRLLLGRPVDRGRALATGGRVGHHRGFIERHLFVAWRRTAAVVHFEAGRRAELREKSRARWRALLVQRKRLRLGRRGLARVRAA